MKGNSHKSDTRAVLVDAPCVGVCAAVRAGRGVAQSSLIVMCDDFVYDPGGSDGWF